MQRERAIIDFNDNRYDLHVSFLGPSWETALAIYNIPDADKNEVGWKKKVDTEAITTKNNGNAVGALSPVNLKGLHQGWTQTSVYLLVIIPQVSIPRLFSSNDRSNSIHNFGTQNQPTNQQTKQTANKQTKTKSNSTCFGPYFYYVGTKHRNLNPAGWLF